MATFFMFGKYSLEGMKGISAGRSTKAIALVKKHGGELKAGYALLGDVDLGASFSTAQAVSMDEFDMLMG